MIESEQAAEQYEQGINLLAEGDAAGAVRCFRAAIRIDDSFFDAYHGLMRTLIASGLHEQAVGIGLALVAQNAQDPMSHSALALALQAAGHEPEASRARARARLADWRLQLAESCDEARRP